jgi:hypothetical protein
MKRMKIIGIAVLVLFVGFYAAVKITGSTLSGTVKQLVLSAASESLNGTLTVGEVDLSLSGSLVVKNPVIKDKDGKQIAAASAVSVSFDISDLLGKKFGMDRVRKITVEDAVFDVVRDKDERWNAGDSLMKKKSDGPTVFRGQIILKNVTSNLSMDTTKASFQNIEGQIDFASYPVIGIDLRTKNASSVINAKGTWKQDGGGSLSIKSEGAELSAFLPSIPLKGPVALEAVTIGTNDKPVTKGTFKIPNGSLSTMSFANASGEFTFQDSILTLSNTKAAAFGGTIFSTGAVYPATLRYVQKVSGQNIDVTQLTDKDIQGRVDFSADVRGQGSWDEANADGNFAMGSGSVSGISFSSMTGNFTKRGAQMHFYNIRAQIAGQMIDIGDATSLEGLKERFKKPSLPGIKPPTPAIPAPSAPRLPGLPRVF